MSSETGRADESAVFDLRGVSYAYPDGTRALDGVSASIGAGRHTVILGPSGSGKTTLLGCLSGRLAPTAGSVSGPRGVATIYQDLRLVAERSVLGNVLDGALGRTGMVRSVLGVSREERELAEQLLSDVGLAEHAGKVVGELSGGERQRVAIARALMQKPRAVLADEPVGALDPETARRIMALVRSLATERGVTLVSVLHDHRLAEEVADDALMLRSGVVVGCSGAGCGEGWEATDAGSGVDCGGPLRSAAVSGEAGAATSSVRTPSRPGWMKPASFMGVALLAALAYGCSASSLELDELSGRSVRTGLDGFIPALIPSGWSEIAELPWPRLLASLVETLQMSLIGTTMGIASAYPLAILAARNTGPRFARRVFRQLLNALRTVPSLVWALFFVAAVGFGPLAGVMALAVYSAGYLGKFFYEAFENTPRAAQDALREIGANGTQRFFRAVMPASRQGVVAACLFMLEYNVRAASVLGIVDAGGIGYYIKFYLDIRNFPAALACLLLIFVVVIALDAVSERYRARLTRS